MSSDLAFPVTFILGFMQAQTGRHKFFRQSGGRGFYADVTVVARSTTAGPLVEVGRDVFAWLKEDYGPDAWEWTACDDFRAAAVRGARFAITHTQQPIDPSAIAVVITQIHAAPADTCPDSVAFATCHATWQALGIAGSNEPRLNGSEIVFDE